MVKTNISLRDNPVVTIGDGRPTWPADDTAKPSRTEGSTRFCVPSGDLGTHAMHPPRKHESKNDDRTQSNFEVRGRAQRPSPTRRFCIRQAGSICYSVAMSGRVRQAENVFVAIRKAIDNRNARADTAVRPYAEIWHPMGKRESKTVDLRLTERTSLQAHPLRRAAGTRYLGTRNAATAIQMVLLTRLRDKNRIGCGLNP